MIPITAWMDETRERLTQHVVSGGMHTHASIRMVLYALATVIPALDILELGYDAGYTTEVLASTGANVIGIDNETEHGDVKDKARERLAAYPNCTLIKADSLSYLTGAPAESFDLIFVDDNHTEAHVMAEAQQIRRVLRPGGIAAFHDTQIGDGIIWRILDIIFHDWNRMDIPSPNYSAKENFGFGLVRKPL